jgi:hypothetical protein
MIEDVLPFLEGWDIDSDEQLFNISRGSSTSRQTPRLGWIIGSGISSTDSLAQLTLIGDEFSLNISPNFLYTSGLTYPNNNFPYLTVYNPVSGTQGNFVIAFAPARPLPIKKALQYVVSLPTQSTQSSATVFVETTTYFIYDKTKFLASLKEYNSAISPSSPVSSSPSREQGRTVLRRLSPSSPAPRSQRNLSEEDELELLR